MTFPTDVPECLTDEERRDAVGETNFQGDPRPNFVDDPLQCRSLVRGNRILKRNSGAISPKNLTRVEDLGQYRIHGHRIAPDCVNSEDSHVGHSSPHDELVRVHQFRSMKRNACGSWKKKTVVKGASYRPISRPPE